MHIISRCDGAEPKGQQVGCPARSSLCEACQPNRVGWTWIFFPGLLLSRPPVRSCKALVGPWRQMVLHDCNRRLQRDYTKDAVRRGWTALPMEGYALPWTVVASRPAVYNQYDKKWHGKSTWSHYGRVRDTQLYRWTPGWSRWRKNTNCDAEWLLDTPKFLGWATRARLAVLCVLGSSRSGRPTRLRGSVHGKDARVDEFEPSGCQRTSRHDRLDLCVLWRWLHWPVCIPVATARPIALTRVRTAAEICARVEDPARGQW